MRIVYTSGTFDLFHKNHLQMIKYASQLGDKLIVGVNTDEHICTYKDPPIIPFEERIAIIENIKNVDMAIPQKNFKIEEIAQNLNINVFVVGDDWKGKFDYLRDFGIEVYYFPYGLGTSSSNVKQKIYDQYLKLIEDVDNHRHPDIKRG